ncbi:HAMP domain-containing histidine kinase [Paenibacillus albidus]|uniref:sensor histidine kinase n=1 Tax=Paenibacillus albidus TaxID=2041023 RepID=UPI001BE714A5|nr:HAMP domain-containing sensor histidine kinase [Paenibacillus albidus]MBT2290430.1 HAMP domain-containing histidine kinase [Paenibacillus albidus]
MILYILSCTSIIFILVISFLATRLWNINRQLVRSAASIDEIRMGSINQRIRIPTTNVHLSELGGGMNRLLDEFGRNMERLRILENERKNMIAHLSHDLRTPLTSMLGYVELLQQDQTLTESERQRYLQIITAKGNKLDTLIRDFFELSKLESSEIPLETDRINMVGIVEEVIASFYHQFQHAQLSPQLKLPSYPLYVLGNNHGIERILNNLFSNVLRYGSAGGIFGVEVRETAEWVHVDVWDRGQGIADMDIKYIFERLYTGRASRNMQDQGNGLGLTIVKRLVERQNGRIHVSSIPDAKTCFTFCLPRVT